MRSKSSCCSKGPLSTVTSETRDRQKLPGQPMLDVYTCISSSRTRTIRSNLGTWKTIQVPHSFAMKSCRNSVIWLTFLVVQPLMQQTQRRAGKSTPWIPRQQVIYRLSEGKRRHQRGEPVKEGEYLYGAILYTSHLDRLWRKKMVKSNIIIVKVRIIETHYVRKRETPGSRCLPSMSTCAISIPFHSIQSDEHQHHTAYS